MNFNKKSIIILLLIVVNIFLLTILYQKNVSNKEIITTSQISLCDIQFKNEKYIKNHIEYNIQINDILINDIKIINDSSQTLNLPELEKKYKIVIYFPKFACKDCIRTLFRLIKENSKFNPSDFLIISDFYSLDELKFYKEEFNLQDFDLFLLEKSERMEFCKYPIVFPSKKNRLVFLFDTTYPNLLNEFLNYYI